MSSNNLKAGTQAQQANPNHLIQEFTNVDNRCEPNERRDGTVIGMDLGRLGRARFQLEGQIMIPFSRVFAGLSFGMSLRSEILLVSFTSRCRNHWQGDFPAHRRIHAVFRFLRHSTSFPPKGRAVLS